METEHGQGRERLIMTNDHIFDNILSATVSGGVAGGAARTVIGALGTTIGTSAGSVFLVSTAPLAAGIGAAVTVGNLVSKLFDD